MRCLSHRIVLVAVFAALLVAALPSASLAVDCAAAWAPNTAYTVGQVVSYGGHNYSCRQAHTSLVTWEPPNVGALWLDQGACTPGTGTATPTARPTVPPRATATPTTVTRAT